MLGLDMQQLLMYGHRKFTSLTAAAWRGWAGGQLERGLDMQQLATAAEDTLRRAGPWSPQVACRPPPLLSLAHHKQRTPSAAPALAPSGHELQGLLPVVSIYCADEPYISVY